MKTCLGKKKTNSFADVLKGRRTVMTDFVSYATSRYCPDEEQTKLLAEFHKHVWKDCKIETVGQLTDMRTYICSILKSLTLSMIQRSMSLDLWI